MPKTVQNLQRLCFRMASIRSGIGENMTESETIEAIQFDLKIGGEIHSQVLRDAIDVAIQALEKQIPKRPIECFNGNEWICECPVCKGITDTPNEVEIECIQYCGWCGQKLDWSEE